MKYSKYREYLERTARELTGEPEPQKTNWWDIAMIVAVASISAWVIARMIW